MVMRRAHIEDGVVVNISIVEALEPGEIDGEGAAIGDLYADGVFSKPPPVPAPVPSAVTPLQIRRALLREGLLDDVQAFVDQADLETRMAWEYAVEIQRGNPLIAACASALGKTEAEIDDLFRLASTL